LLLPPKSILARQFSHPVAAGEDEHIRNNRKKQVSISNRDDAGWLAATSCIPLRCRKNSGPKTSKT
jgi:hypothetical protein